MGWARIGARGGAAILCTGGLDVIRKEAWPFYRTSAGVRLCWELEEPKGPNGLPRDAHLLHRSNASFYYSALLKVFLFGNPNKNTFEIQEYTP